VLGFSLNYTEIIFGACFVLKDLSHAPTATDAIVHASESILATQLVISCELVLNFWPGEFFDDAVMHDEKLLLFVVGGSGETRLTR
jgi:hypothetical protein